MNPLLHGLLKIIFIQANDICEREKAIYIVYRVLKNGFRFTL